MAKDLSWTWRVFESGFYFAIDAVRYRGPVISISSNCRDLSEYDEKKKIESRSI